MSKSKKDLMSPPSDALWLVPLGGSGEIGMNMNLYGYAGKWLMVDCGITFPDEMAPGIEVITPDPSFIAERKDDLLGIVVTHGHEDHLGAIEYLWPQLQCPIYASPFNAEMIRAKLAEGNKKKKKSSARVTELPLGGHLELGPFSIDMIPVTHSIPEAQMMVLTTAVGKILHTGDWKFDPHPVVGTVTDMKAIQALGHQDIMAIVGDSTNALVIGHSGSELEVQECFKKIFDRYKNRIVLTCFASNIARVKSIYAAAKESGRSLSLVGRSLWRNAEIAEACGYLPEYKDFLSVEEAMQAPRDKIVMICTGCQGEVRAALSRIAVFDHPDVELEEGDAVIFSSREIPGNEKPIGRVQNLLLEQGIELLTADVEKVHVSGHPAQDELHELYKMVKPRRSIPVHGELRHQMEHARIAKECGVKQVFPAKNGTILSITPNGIEAVGDVPVGCLGLDGKVLRPLHGDAVKERRKLGYSGAVVIAVALDRRCDLAADPQISLLGLEEDEQIDEIYDDLVEALLIALDKLTRESLQDDEIVKTALAQTARRVMNETFGKRPVVEVSLMRV